MLIPYFYPSPFTSFQHYELKSFFFITSVAGAFFFLAYPLYSIPLPHTPPSTTNPNTHKHIQTHTHKHTLHLSMVRSINQSWRLDFNKCHIKSSRAASVEQTYPKGKGERDRAWIECLPHSCPHPHAHTLHPPGLSIKKHGMGGKEQDDSAIKLSSSLALPMSNSTCLHRFRVTFEPLCLF